MCKHELSFFLYAQELFGLSSVLAFCFMMIAASWGELHTITHSFEIQPTLVLCQYRPTTCSIPIRCRWNALVSISYKFKLVSMSGQPLLFFSPRRHRTIKCLSQVLPLRPPSNLQPPTSGWQPPTPPSSHSKQQLMKVGQS